MDEDRHENKITVKITNVDKTADRRRNRLGIEVESVSAVTDSTVTWT
jgi:hypothetical protein